MSSYVCLLAQRNIYNTFFIQFDATEVSAAAEKSHNMDILSRLGREPSARKPKTDGSDVVNVRKAVKFASQGKGSAALARQSTGNKGKRGKR